MKTTLKVTIAAVAVIAVAGVFGAGFVLAQGTTPWGMGYGNAGMMTGNGPMRGNAELNGSPAPGYGMMNGHGMMNNGSGMMTGIDMNAMHQWMSSNGGQGMHTTLWNGLAASLNLTPDELSAELAGGNTLAQIADAQGISQDQLAASLEASMKAGLDEAVADGVLTREQADVMLTHMNGQYQWMITQMNSGS